METSKSTPPMHAGTPMIRQYLEIKQQHENAFLFFRMGDFYEMFFEDAVEGSKLLGIALTRRDKHRDESVPLCGVPVHSVETYIRRLVEGGRRVAICEQMEPPAPGKRIVRREVVRIVTPGTIRDTDSLESRRNNYLAALALSGDRFGLASLDLTTGAFSVTEIGREEVLADELARLDPREVLLPQRAAETPFAQKLSETRYVTPWPDVAFSPDRGEESLASHFQVQSLDGFGLGGRRAAVGAAGAVFAYARETQRADMPPLQPPVPYDLSDYMVLDEATRRNLELIRSTGGVEGAGTLLHVIDSTATPMGARLLRGWLEYPLRDPAKISERHDAVDELLGRSDRRAEIRGLLGEIRDLERTVSRLASSLASARDLIALAASLRNVPKIEERLEGFEAALLVKPAMKLDALPDVVAQIEQAIVDDPPALIRDGGFIRPGYSEELDRLRSTGGQGKQWMAELEARERGRTGIANLRVRFNRVFGYYIEVTKSQLGRVPPDYHRKQTTSSGERYFTPELKEWETRILRADEEAKAIEGRLFNALRGRVLLEAARVRPTASGLARLDVLCSLAEVAAANGYVRPAIQEGKGLEIVDGRHPVVERMRLGERFVPNDTRLDPDSVQILLLTGPNMSGKSTYLRQVALIVLLAQIGSFVPARGARIGAVDRIFTRVGASDDLARGRSTFMVEMSEAANILRNATERSLIILDEIGRGTSTFDGLALAWAIAERLHDDPGLRAKTLFATHYHELTRLVEQKPRVRNAHVAVKEWQEKIIFLRKVVDGATSRSYGIQVARLAGIPEPVVSRAREILVQLERGEEAGGGDTPDAARRAEEGQLGLFSRAAPHPIESTLRGLDLESTTPLQAHDWLRRMKEELES